VVDVPELKKQFGLFILARANTVESRCDVLAQVRYRGTNNSSKSAWVMEKDLAACTQ
jgi:hypothetical protein